MVGKSEVGEEILNSYLAINTFRARVLRPFNSWRNQILLPKLVVKISSVGEQLI